MRNQRKNELPLMRPTIPPARPKPSMITSSPPPATATYQIERLEHREDHGGGDDDDDVEHGKHQADDELQRECCSGDQNQTGNRTPEHRRPPRCLPAGQYATTRRTAPASVERAFEMLEAVGAHTRARVESQAGDAVAAERRRGRAAVRAPGLGNQQDLGGYVWRGHGDDLPLRSSTPHWPEVQRSSGSPGPAGDPPGRANRRPGRWRQPA